MYPRVVTVVSCLGLVFLAQSAHAGLIGTTVNSDLETQSTGGWNSNSATVGAGVEFSRLFSGSLWGLELDVADTSFTLHYFNNFPDTGQGAANAGLISFNLTQLSNVTNVSLANSNFASGLGSATFNSTSITVPITTLIPPGGTNYSATWNITFAGTDSSAPNAGVPEPSSVFLCAIGVAFVGLGLRRRSRRPQA